MANLIVTSCLSIVVAWVTTKIWTWRRAYTAALPTKFPVYLSPVHINDTWWLMLYPLLLPILSLLPSRYRKPWLPMAQVWNIWKSGHDPFQEVGTDTFILATPSGNVLWTCDANLCHEFEAQRSKVQVPVDLIKFFEVYGPAIGTVEGNEWKKHRKIVTSAFTPTTHGAVWTETCKQTTALIKNWSTQDLIVRVVKHSTSRLALHVISAVFFDRILEWNDHDLGFESPPAGHEISFEQALFTVVARLGVLAVVPRALLGRLPIPRVREANVAFTEWAKYMEELREVANTRLSEVANKKTRTVLESIILAGKSEPGQKAERSLSEESVSGNIFFTIMAGHETVGNALAFALYLLAIYPEYQEKIQEDLDNLLQNRPWNEWSADHEFQTLQGGWMGAVIKEVLRPYAVVPFITRRVVAPITVVDSDGETHVVPEKTLASMDYAAAFRNPKTWAPRAISAERRAQLHNSPALDFDPTRWLAPSNRSFETNLSTADDGNEEEKDNGKDSTGPPLVFPFGQGPRTCPGRLFAQVEMAAAIATILRDYNIQLVVDDQTRQACGGDEKVAWEKTRDEAIITLYDKIQTNITIELEAELPIQLVKRR